MPHIAPALASDCDASRRAHTRSYSTPLLAMSDPQQQAELLPPGICPAPILIRPDDVHFPSHAHSDTATGQTHLKLGSILMNGSMRLIWLSALGLLAHHISRE